MEIRIAELALDRSCCRSGHRRATIPAVAAASFARHHSRTTQLPGAG